jgi:hypothetical protein
MKRYFVVLEINSSLYIIGERDHLARAKKLARDVATGKCPVLETFEIYSNDLLAGNIKAKVYDSLGELYSVNLSEKLTKKLLSEGFKKGYYSN